MEKKKKLKRLIITFFCLVIFTGIVTASIFLLKPFQKNNQDPPTKQPTINRYNIAQSAIFNEHYSQNYNGIYKFSRINMVYFHDLSQDSIAMIYDHYNVDDSMGLLNYFSNEKKENLIGIDETLIIENTKFQINRNSNPYFIGTIYGNDDLSILLDNENKKAATLSLLNISQEELKILDSTENSQLSNTSAELFITKTINLQTADKTLHFDIVYVYEIQK